MKRLISLILALSLFIGMVPVMAPKAEAAAVTTAEVTQRIETYWNIVTENGTKTVYWNKNKNQATLISEASKGDYKSSVSYSACTGSYRSTGCVSNEFGGGTQCNGFSVYMVYIGCGLLPGNFANDGTYYYEVDDSFKFQPGDRIFYGWRTDGTTPTHWLFVYKVENGRVYTIEANWGGACKINRRSFSETEVRGFVNRFNSTNKPDFVWRPHCVVACPHDSYDALDRCTGCRAQKDYTQEASWQDMGGAAYTVTETKGSCVLRTAPYDDPSTLLDGRMNRGATFLVKGRFKNSKDNLWYIGTYGGKTCYVYSENLEPITKEFSTLKIILPEKYTHNVNNPVDITGTITSNTALKTITATRDGNTYMKTNPLQVPAGVTEFNIQ